MLNIMACIKEISSDLDISITIYDNLYSGSIFTTTHYKKINYVENSFRCCIRVFNIYIAYLFVTLHPDLIEFHALGDVCSIQ